MRWVGWTGPLIIAAAGLFAGCARESDSKPSVAETEMADVVEERVKLPGFSILAPKGEVVAHSKSPSVGEYEVDVTNASEGSEFKIAWSSDASTRKEWDADFLPLLLNTLSKVMPGARLLHREDVAPDRWFVLAGTESSPVGVGVVQCDPRFEVQITMTRYRDVKRMIPLLVRTLQSVQCEVSDENRSALAPATRLPQTLGSVRSDFGWMFRSIDGEALVLNFTTGRLPDDPRLVRAVYLEMLKSIGLFVPASGLVALKPGPRARPGVESLWRATRSGVDPIFIGSLFCEQQGATLMFIWARGRRPSDALAWERLGQVDCPGTSSIPSPEFASLVDQGCDAGDSAACAIKDETKD